ncbi:MAG: hypothetical protein KJ058_05295 [Thermoanaerobaculia bacterium]|nr:hypothetical protein [Thermoanaerobaculia bacterium]MCZ7651437.1 DUF6370 family protein [Thermoanaerobaculia bacterium]
MKKTLAFAFALLLLLAAAPALRAGEGEVTLSGKIACGHCTLKLEGLTSCQDIFVAERDGQSVNYWLVKNDVAKEFGHTCAGEKKVTVTGKILDQDGHTWIEASKIEKIG